MTQDDFFGAIEHNLQRLAAKGERVGACGDRVRGFRCITRGDSYCPPNVRCYDLLPDEPGSGASAVFRVFACFADESTHDGYRRAKFAIRKWYQESGRARGCEQPRAALVVGAAAQWPEGMEPNADDMPCASVAFRMLAAPHVRPEMGLGIAKAGDFGSFRAVCRALVPEAFDKVERRVRDCVERHATSLWRSSGRCRMKAATAWRSCRAPRAGRRLKRASASSWGRQCRRLSADGWLPPSALRCWRPLRLCGSSWRDKGGKGLCDGIFRFSVLQEGFAHWR